MIQTEIHNKEELLMLLQEKDALLLQKEKILLAMGSQIQEQGSTIELLQHRIKELERLIFGRKSERFMPVDENQMAFDFGDKDKGQPIPQKTEKITYTRRKPSKPNPAIRTSIPAHLPRKEEFIEPDNIEEGSKKIGEEITEILEYNPATIFVRKIIRPKYALPEEKGIIIGELPTLPIPKGNAGPGLLAHILVSKFVDHLPYYRQAQIFRRDGVEISKSTFNGWFNASCDLLVLLYECLMRKVQQCDYLMADESPIPVQDENQSGRLHTGYHWVYYSPVEKLVCFHYQPSRGCKGPDEFLMKFKGTLQTDGYTAYNHLEHSERITLLACMAHCRRKFEHALESNRAKSEEALAIFGKLYDTERQAKEHDITNDERKALRAEQSAPVMGELHQWLNSNLMEVLPKSPVGKAIGYTLNLWPRLKRYLEDGKYEMDNNLIENSIRPMAIGRKNYLFAGSHQAAQRAAMMYSFFGTCKLNGINPYEWLRDILTHIPDHPANRLELLLPVKRE